MKEIEANYNISGDYSIEEIELKTSFSKNARKCMFLENIILSTLAVTIPAMIFWGILNDKINSHKTKYSPSTYTEQQIEPILIYIDKEIYIEPDEIKYSQQKNKIYTL